MPGRIADDEQRRAATQGPPGWKEAMMPQPAARIAQIPYLNVAPFLLHWDQITEASEGRWIAVEAVPRALGLAAEAGEVDAGIFPTADLLRLGDELEPLIDPEAAPAGYGIATRHRVDSVLLFLRDDANPPVAAVTGRVLAATEVRALHGATIAVTGESSTSARLLRILLEERHAVRPAGYPRRALGSESIPPEAGAVLTIGDEALRWRQRPPAGFRLGMDLAAEWGRWTNLPFVFARWGVRRSLPAETKKWLARFVGHSLAPAEKVLPDRTAASSAFRLDERCELGSPEDLLAYLRNFIYRLGAEELIAVERFRRSLQPILEEEAKAAPSR